MKRLILGLILCLSVLPAQTYKWSRGFARSATPPSTCVPGERYFNTTSGTAHYCGSVDSWTQFGAGGSGESNTASNVGGGTFYWFYQKAGVDLELYSFDVTAPFQASLAANKITFSIVQADTDNDGYLSQTDWDTFNAKESETHASDHQNGGADEVATATAGANAIPKAGGGGTLATGWIPDLSGTYQPLDAALTALAGGSDFVDFSGPAAATKTFTLPNASAAILTDNAAVTVAEGGTGLSSGTSGGIPYFSAAGAMGSSAALTDEVLVKGGGAGNAPQDSTLTETKVKTRQAAWMVGADNGSVMVDGDDQDSFYLNDLGFGITLIKVWCETDADTSTINLQRDDGSAANILSASLACDVGGQTSCASGCDVNTIQDAEDNIADGEKIDLEIVAAGGTAKRVVVYLKYTID